MKNYKIGTRLAGGFGLLIALSLVMLTSGIYQLNRVSSSTQQMMQEPLRKERLASDWHAALVAGIQRGMAVARSNDDSLVELFTAENERVSKENSKRQEQFTSLISTPEEKTLFDKVGEYRQVYLEKRDAIITEKGAVILSVPEPFSTTTSSQRPRTIWQASKHCAITSVPVSTKWDKTSARAQAVAISSLPSRAC
ncbi:MCP four helix bundle domain-containing protein [Pectobacterium parvum]|uniref:MCP four helix bundle domain-containing protein n=1 Tax=Pectobacterium parvum TaxID=2778550 RepID=UPI001FDA5674|nr:MCP four helix bundle domain-containing protein [Pectobacterium parvum]